ncbi:hypothetical protein HPB51_008993 [Rhipicephalus microplus]|uniref:Uncharacterized protein n=1 Tax=Rhipicephalus microplus TaxID=6941 RepID=A0A9J6D8X3_RHIMP|nr:hypothetical protein HPB51_008993 [Rhipicephalus microplus]
MMSLYPLRTRTRKWPVRVISHFASFALCNSWLEYIRDANAEGLLKKDTINMMAIQRGVANCLLSVNKPQKKRGRPSSENPQVMKKKAPNASPLPVSTLCYDGIYHWPQQTNILNAQRCRREGCSSKSRVRCRKARKISRSFPGFQGCGLSGMQPTFAIPCKVQQYKCNFRYSSRLALSNFGSGTLSLTAR